MNLLRGTDATGVPGPEQLHLQFGPDAATQMVASWATPVPVAQTRLRLGTLDGGFGTTIDAVMRTYTEAITGQPVWTYHAVLDHLEPATDHVYEVLHDGAPPIGGRFRTGTLGRAPFRFTSFGDLSIPARWVCRPRPRFGQRGLHRGRGRSDRSVVPPHQRRPLLRQLQRRTGGDLAGVGGNPVAAGAGESGPNRGLVICEVGREKNGRRPPQRLSEPAEWLAARADKHPYGFTLFDVDPVVLAD